MGRSRRRALRASASLLALAGLASLSLSTGAWAQAERGKGAVVRVSGPQALTAAVARATAGTTLQLASGHYGSFSVTNRKLAAPGLTIEPQPGAQVDFSAIGVYGSENVTIKDVELVVDKAQYGVEVNGSAHVVLDGLKIHAPPGNVPSAMMLRGVHDVTVEDCDMRNLGFGINFLESDHLKVLRNTFADLQVDAIRGAASNVEVIGNHATSFHPKDGDHPDFIQFWGDASKPSTGNVIKDNVYERGQGDVVQGIFLENNKDVVISGNALLGTMYNGISLSAVQTAVVEDNFVQGYRDMATRIITRGESADVTVRNNISQSVVTYNEPGRINPHYREEHNRTIGPARVGDDKALQDWLARRRGG